MCLGNSARIILIAPPIPNSVISNRIKFVTTLRMEITDGNFTSFIDIQQTMLARSNAYTPTITGSIRSVICTTVKITIQQVHYVIISVS